MTKDPFEKFGIDHLSPSSLRLWRECPAVWIGKYMLRAPDEMGPGAWRGLAVEAGVDRLLFGHEPGEALAAMQNKWDDLAQGLIEPDCLREMEALPGFLIQAGVAFANHPMPLVRQSRIELTLPGIGVPLVGFCDWLWPDRGDDLKTTWRMPQNNQPDPEHVAQVSCYSMFHGVPFSLTYVSPKKWVRYEVTKPMAEAAYERVIETAHAIRSMLSHVDSGEDALSMFSPDYTSYFFRPPMVDAIRAAKAARVVPGEPRSPKLQAVE
jgi:hypothetical protein